MDEIRHEIEKFKLLMYELVETKGMDHPECWKRVR